MAARIDPVGAFNFLVEAPEIGKANFSEVSGLTAEVAAIEYREGGENALTVHKLPGLIKYSNIVLKRGISRDLGLWNWFKSIVGGQLQRATVSIKLLDNQRQPVAAWVAREAWPCKYAGPNLDARDNDVAIETLELCHEGLERVE